MQNLHGRFDWYYIGQIYGGDFAKFCGLLRIYELYLLQKKFPPIVGNLKAEEEGTFSPATIQEYRFRLDSRTIVGRTTLFSRAGRTVSKLIGTKN